jgi:ribosome-associated protein
MLRVKMDSKTLALLCRDLADNRKAENIVVMDVKEVSSITDYFVICTGTSEPHIRAIVSEIVDKLRDDHDLKPNSHDGTMPTAWIVLDYFDVIVHVMRPDVREHYKLEDLWADAPQVNARKPRKPRAKKEPELSDAGASK